MIEYAMRRLSYIHVDGRRIQTNLSDWDLVLSGENNAGLSPEYNKIYFRDGRFLFVRLSEDDCHGTAWLVTRSEAHRASLKLASIERDFEWVRISDEAFTRLGPDYRWYLLRLVLLRLRAAFSDNSNSQVWRELYSPSDSTIPSLWDQRLFATPIFEFEASSRHLREVPLSGLALAISDLLNAATTAVQNEFDQWYASERDMPFGPIPIRAETNRLLVAVREAIGRLFPTDNASRFETPPAEYVGRRDVFERDLVIYLQASSQRMTNAAIQDRLELLGLSKPESANTIHNAYQRIVERLGLPAVPDRSGRPRK